jgi:glutathione peroxidase
MKRDTLVLIGAAVGLAALSAMVIRSGMPETMTDAHTATPVAGDEGVSPHVLHYEMERLTGGMENLADYQGKVVLIVNTASKCGLTPQYEGLEALYEAKKDEGFVILGFPANNFSNQEPGTNEEIAEFCKATYDVKFPMFAKISVKGDDMHPLYEQLTSQPEPIGGEVQWNFQKYLVDKDGNVVAKFEPRVKPDDARLLEMIDGLLASEAGAGS